MLIIRPHGVGDVTAYEPRDELLADCRFMGMGVHAETMARVRLYRHTSGVILWV